MDNEDFLWAGIPFLSGISGHQKAPCGALSAAAVALGLRHRHPIADKPAAKQARTTIRRLAGRLAVEFEKEFGAIACGELLGIDFSQDGAYKRFRQSEIWKDKCQRYVTFIIDRLYAFEAKGQ